jgi:hypothetical protein
MEHVIFNMEVDIQSSDGDITNGDDEKVESTQMEIWR